MPEGPEIHLSARYINKVGSEYNFSGPVVKSEVSTKNPDVPWTAEKYSLIAEARGKELKIHLLDLSPTEDVAGVNERHRRTHVLIRFGMSGCFKFTSADQALPKHAHLRFAAADGAGTLSFVDYRRFGRWQVEGEWGCDRGPDPMLEYDAFRANVLQNLSAAAFNRPVCEILLNQKFFNGIGNYLRAEILFRCGIPPFESARKVFEPIEGIKVEGGEVDILELCNTVPKEVLNIGGGKGYDVESDPAEESAFTDWLRCYNKAGMSNLVDANKRTIWFRGPAGSMAPKMGKTRGMKTKTKKDGDAGVVQSQNVKNKVKLEVKLETKVKLGRDKKQESALSSTRVVEKSARPIRKSAQVKTDKETHGQVKRKSDEIPPNKAAAAAAVSISPKKLRTRKQKSS